MSIDQETPEEILRASEVSSLDEEPKLATHPETVPEVEFWAAIHQSSSIADGMRIARKAEDATESFQPMLRTPEERRSFTRPRTRQSPRLPRITEGNTDEERWENVLTILKTASREAWRSESESVANLVESLCQTLSGLDVAAEVRADRIHMERLLRIHVTRSDASRSSCRLAKVLTTAGSALRSAQLRGLFAEGVREIAATLPMDQEGVILRKALLESAKDLSPRPLPERPPRTARERLRLSPSEKASRKSLR
jgi:hypothetical protein